MKNYLKNKLEILKGYNLNLVFVVNYNEIHKSKIRIIDILPLHKFYFQYDENKNPTNWAIKLDGTCWDGEFILS